MRRATLAGAILLALALSAPGTAVAAPGGALCTPDPSRVNVPPNVDLDVCVSATDVTVRNDRATPVVVQASGDLGRPVSVRQRNDVAAQLLHLMLPTSLLLMPEDAVRWPLGAGGATLSLSPVEPAAAPAIAETLATELPRPGDKGFDQSEYEAFADVVRDVAAAIDARVACAEDKNFLQAEACDVTAAIAIGRSLSVALPRSTAVDLLPDVLDMDNWTAWAASTSADAEIVDGTSLVVAPLGGSLPTPALAPSEGLAPVPLAPRTPTSLLGPLGELVPGLPPVRGLPPVSGLPSVTGLPPVRVLAPVPGIPQIPGSAPAPGPTTVAGPVQVPGPVPVGGPAPVAAPAPAPVAAPAPRPAPAPVAAPAPRPAAPKPAPAAPAPQTQPRTDSSAGRNVPQQRADAGRGSQQRAGDGPKQRAGGKDDQRGRDDKGKKKNGGRGRGR